MYNFSDNIQRTILYLAKSDDDFLIQILPLVKSSYFEFPAHTNIFEAITEYRETYGSLPNDDCILLAVEGNLDKHESLEDYQDELDLINGIDKDSLNSKSFILDKIEEFAKEEALKSAIAKSVGFLKDKKFGHIEDEIRSALSICRNVDTGQEYFADVSDRWRRQTLEDNSGRLPTPVDSINRALKGGIARKELAIVTAPPGKGKSLWLCNVGVLALQLNMNVLHVSLEMSEDRVAARYDSMMTLIPQMRLAEMQDTLQERHKIFKQNWPDGKLIIKEFNTGQENTNSIRALINQLELYEDFKPDLLIVDYLELLQPNSSGMPTHESQEVIARELRSLCSEQGIYLWTATQPNREGAKTRIITQTELADSYGKIRPADFAVSLNQDQEEYDAGKMRVYVMKSRNSGTNFLAPMAIDYLTLRMENPKVEESDE